MTASFRWDKQPTDKASAVGNYKGGDRVTLNSPVSNFSLQMTSFCFAAFLCVLLYFARVDGDGGYNASAIPKPSP